MADPNDSQAPGDRHTDRQSTVREVHTERRSGNSMAFIVGGLVVAVLVIGWVLFSGGGGEVAETGGGDVNVSVEGADSAAEDAAQSAGEAAEDAGAAVGEAAEDAGAAVEGAAEEAAEETQ